MSRLERTGRLYFIRIAIGAVVGAAVALWFVIEPVMKAWGWAG